MFEKPLDLERKVLTFMQDSFDITKTSILCNPTIYVTWHQYCVKELIIYTLHNTDAMSHV